MKKLSLIFGVLAIGLLSCNTPYYPPPPPMQSYDVIQGPGGQQYVTCYDNGTEFLMDLAMYQMLIGRNGGYSNITNYYHVHQNLCPRYNANTYGSWSRVGSYNQGGTYTPRTSGVQASGNTPALRSTMPQTRTSGVQASGNTPVLRSTYSPPSPPRTSGFGSSGGSAPVMRSTYSPPASRSFGRSSSGSSSSRSFGRH